MGSVESRHAAAEEHIVAAQEINGRADNVQAFEKPCWLVIRTTMLPGRMICSGTPPGVIFVSAIDGSSVLSHLQQANTSAVESGAARDTVLGLHNFACRSVGSAGAADT